MRLEELGYNDRIEKLTGENNLNGFDLGRVVAEHKERYIVTTEKGDFEAEITGNLRYSANGREDFPAVGDWVTMVLYDSGFSVIHSVLPRVSVISRLDVGKASDIQIIAANVDYALLVQAADRDFNINRLERYLTICYEARVLPIIVITKTDLAEGKRVNDIINSIKARIKDVPVIPVSNLSQDGYVNLKGVIEKGKTYCLLGSSGAGKSTLINNLSGRNIMRTGTISLSTSKGRHVTSHREMIIIENGGILIDNPGMREVGIADAAEGLEFTFDLINRLSEGCRFRDCTHTNEDGCAVMEAVERGELDNSSYENFLRLEREKAHFQSSLAERRKKDKAFGKMIREYKNKTKGGRG